MAQTFFSRLFGRAPRVPARSVPRRLRNHASLAVESLEDRVTPSGGPGLSGGPGSSGGSSGSGGSGGGPASSNSQAIVSGSSGALATTSSNKTYQLGTVITALSGGGMTISQLFSGYPIAPGGGPALQNNLVTLSDPSSVPWSMQNSTVAVIPILVTTSTSSGSGSQSYTLVMLDTTTGMTYAVSVNMLSSTSTSGQGGPSAPAP
jgi:hypothetical protein